MYAVDVPAFLNIKSRQARFRRLNKSCVVFVPFDTKSSCCVDKKTTIKIWTPKRHFLTNERKKDLDQKFFCVGNFFVETDS